MTAILGFADLLHSSKCETERTEYAGTIRRNGEHLLAVLNDILDLSKIEAGKLEIEKIPCNLHGLISDVVDLQSVRAESKGLVIRICIADDCPEIIQTDPLRLRQVMLNLLGNALKFTEHGGIEVLLERRECTRRTQAVGESELHISVVDSGIGMTDDQLSRLFNVFSQADSSTSRQFGGTGLGLAISRRLIELLGGEIHAESEYGMGSTFVVILPLKTNTDATSGKTQTNETGRRQALTKATLESQRSLPQPAKWATVPLKPSPQTLEAKKQLSDARILLVEDGIDNQRLISHVLKHTGAEVDVVGNGQLAIDLIHQGDAEYDLILMDMQMPVLDGYQATLRLRQEGYNTPIIALTAHAMADDRARCLEAGCDDYLTKPINRVAMIEILNAQLVRNCGSI